MPQELSPIALFVYRRPQHTLNVLDSLAANAEARESNLYVFCDGPKSTATPSDLEDVAAARRIVRSENRFAKLTLVEQGKNRGLARSIIDGVTQVVNEHGKVIVVEDDLVVGRYFLAYMNDSLQRYRQDERVGQIGACNFFACNPSYPPYFFATIPDCWGWATWKDRWAAFDENAASLLDRLRSSNLIRQFNVDGAYPMEEMLINQINGTVDSWAIRWQATLLLKNWLTLYPNPSMSQHIESLKSTHASVNIVPPLQSVPPVFSTIRTEQHAAVRKAMRRGYAGIGNYDGTLKTQNPSLLLKHVAKVFLPTSVLHSLRGLRKLRPTQ